MTALVVAGCTDGATMGARDDPDPASDGSREADGAAVDDARAVLEDLATAMEESDGDAMLELTTGPARTFFQFATSLHEAHGAESVLFENLRAEFTDGQQVDDGLVRFDGRIGYGSQEGQPPQIYTDLEVVRTDGGWRLDRFVRNDHPIGTWVSAPPGDARITSGPVDAELVALFSDVSCTSGSDENCPEEFADAFAVAFSVTNGTDGELEPVPVELPDGSMEMGWVETSSGRAEPVRAGALMGFPPGRPSPVIGWFHGVSDLAEGGRLHVAFGTPDGASHDVTLELPAYPYDWSR